MTLYLTLGDPDSSGEAPFGDSLVPSGSRYPEETKNFWKAEDSIFRVRARQHGAYPRTDACDLTGISQSPYNGPIVQSADNALLIPHRRHNMGHQSLFSSSRKALTATVAAALRHQLAFPGPGHGRGSAGDTGQDKGCL